MDLTHAPWHTLTLARWLGSAYAGPKEPSCAVRDPGSRSSPPGCCSSSDWPTRCRRSSKTSSRRPRPGRALCRRWTSSSARPFLGSLDLASASPEESAPGEWDHPGAAGDAGAGGRRRAGCDGIPPGRAQLRTFARAVRITATLICPRAGDDDRRRSGGGLPRLNSGPGVRDTDRESRLGRGCASFHRRHLRQGRGERYQRAAPALVASRGIDLVIANGENSAGGFGITARDRPKELFASGIDRDDVGQPRVGQEGSARLPPRSNRAAAAATSPPAYPARHRRRAARATANRSGC